MRRAWKSRKWLGVVLLCGLLAVIAATQTSVIYGPITTPALTVGSGPTITPSGGGTTQFLRADGQWAVPAGGGGSTMVKCGLAPASDTISAGGAFASTCSIPASVLTSGSLVQVWMTFTVTNGSGVNWYPQPEVEGNAGLVLMNPGNAPTGVPNGQSRTQVVHGYLVTSGSGTSAPFAATSLLDYGGSAPSLGANSGTLNTTSPQTVSFVIASIPASSSAQLISASVLVLP
jgi:hypothetical protein